MNTWNRSTSGLVNWFEWEHSGWRSTAIAWQLKVLKHNVRNAPKAEAGAKLKSHNGECDHHCSWGEETVVMEMTLTAAAQQSSERSQEWTLLCIWWFNFDQLPTRTPVSFVLCKNEWTKSYLMYTHMSRSQIRGCITVLLTQISTSHSHNRRITYRMSSCSDQFDRNPISVQYNHVDDFSLDEIDEKREALQSHFLSF